MGMCENDYDLNDLEIKKLNLQGSLVKKLNNIGGLYFCDKCHNVHRPGPCIDLGIDPSEFAKNKKEQVNILTRERVFELLRDKKLEERRVFGGRMLLLILLIKGSLTAKEILKEAQMITEKIRRTSEKYKNFYFEFPYPETDSDFGFVEFLQGEVELGFLKETEGKFAIRERGLDYLFENLSRTD